jgi:hypothetical protein
MGGKVSNHLDQMGTITLLENRAEVNGINACSAPIVVKANEFFTGVSIGVFPKNSSFLT